MKIEFDMNNRNISIYCIEINLILFISRDTFWYQQIYPGIFDYHFSWQDFASQSSATTMWGNKKPDYT